MPKSYTCSTKRYIEINHPKFHSLLDLTCLKIGKAKCVIVPKDAEIATIMKEIKGFKEMNEETAKKYNEIKSRVAAHIITSHVIDDKFKGGVVKAKGGCTLQISAVKDGKFSIVSGVGGKSKAECKLDELYPAPMMRDSSKKREISVAIISSGSLDCGAKEEQKDKLEGGHMESLNDTSRLVTFKKTLTNEIVLTSKSLGVDGFAPVMAGLLKFLDMTPGTELECKKICQFLYPHAIQSYFVIVQPYNSTQMIDDTVLKRWMGAPYFCQDYTSQLNEFVAKHCPEVAQKRSEAMRRIESIPEISTIDSTFKSIYSRNCTEVFGIGKCNDKLWADNFAFEISELFARKKGDMASFVSSVTSLSQSFTGINKEREIRFGNKSFWDNFRSNREPIMEFLKGRYMLYFPDGNYIVEKAPKEPYPYLKSFLALNK